MSIDKKRLKDKMGRMITQSLFLEIKYDIALAMYTLDDEDKTYKGKVYPSLKRLYLESEDPTEYIFAKKYLLGWEHWLRLNRNVLLRKEFDQWRDELEVAIRSAAIQSIMEESAGEKGYQAAKWLADKGWDKRAAGRPSKDEIIRRTAIEDRIKNDFDEDYDRMSNAGTVVN